MVFIMHPPPGGFIQPHCWPFDGAEWLEDAYPGRVNRRVGQGAKDSDQAFGDPRAPVPHPKPSGSTGVEKTNNFSL